VGLPAERRRILADIAAHLLLRALPDIVNQSLLDRHTDYEALHRHVAAAEDADYLRRELETLGLVAFIANHSILPRQSGTSDKPMDAALAIPFLAPDSLMREIQLPHAGMIKGMGIPRGITLITGGGYHGKSTLLRALETGIYNHIPGDGRERCVSNSQSVKVRAYDGRPVVNTDISAFIRNLPFQKDTASFRTTNASGSTSQAATIMEAIESGAEVLFMDEDTCATNFIIRDHKMQQLVSKNDEPITPFIDRVRDLLVEKNISTVLVLGGVGDYFDVAEHVIQVKNYQPADVTEKAHAIADRFPAKRRVEGTSCPFTIRARNPVPESLDPLNEYGKMRIVARDVHRLIYGKQEIDLTDLEQLMELSQTKAIGYAMEHAKTYMNGKTPLPEIVRRVIEDIEETGLDVISRRISGHFAWFRGIELAFAFNRLRGLEMS
jgi:predicted ABC-class ATPase